MNRSFRTMAYYYYGFGYDYRKVPFAVARKKDHS